MIDNKNTHKHTNTVHVARLLPSSVVQAVLKFSTGFGNFTAENRNRNSQKKTKFRGKRNGNSQKKKQNDSEINYISTIE